MKPASLANHSCPQKRARIDKQLQATAQEEQRANKEYQQQRIKEFVNHEKTENVVQLVLDLMETNAKLEKKIEILMIEIEHLEVNQIPEEIYPYNGPNYGLGYDY
jgi:hypothetical protein